MQSEWLLTSFFAALQLVNSHSEKKSQQKEKAKRMKTKTCRKPCFHFTDKVVTRIFAFRRIWKEYWKRNRFYFCLSSQLCAHPFNMRKSKTEIFSCILAWSRKQSAVPLGCWGCSGSCWWLLVAAGGGADPSELATSPCPHPKPSALSHPVKQGWAELKLGTSCMNVSQLRELPSNIQWLNCSQASLGLAPSPLGTTFCLIQVDVIRGTCPKFTMGPWSSGIMEM